MSLIVHYILRNINTFLNLYMLAIIFFLFISFFLVPVVYVPLAFPQINYFTGTLTVCPKSMKQNLQVVFQVCLFLRLFTC